MIIIDETNEKIKKSQTKKAKRMNKFWVILPRPARLVPSFVFSNLFICIFAALFFRLLLLFIKTFLCVWIYEHAVLTTPLHDRPNNFYSFLLSFLAHFQKEKTLLSRFCLSVCLAVTLITLRKMNFKKFFFARMIDIDLKI